MSTGIRSTGSTNPLMLKLFSRNGSRNSDTFYNDFATENGFIKYLNESCC